MNNLYGTAMTQPLLAGNFKFIAVESTTSDEILSTDDESTTGCILEVDLDYSLNLHDLNYDYLLCPENVTINQDDLPPYIVELAEKLNVNCGQTKKLVCNLKNKLRYAVHYKNLKLYCILGMEVSKLHRVTSVQQSKWLKQYIDFNTQKRKESKSEFEKIFYKLMIYSVFGKTMENIKKYMNEKLVDKVSKLKLLTGQPNFKFFKTFSKELTVVHLSRPQITLNKLTYVGMVF